MINALALIGFAVFLVAVAAPALGVSWRALRRVFALPRIQMFAAVLFAAGLIQYGATKSRITFDGGIRSAGGCYTSNDVIHVAWQRDLSGGVYVPESAAVYIDYRPNTETNAEWGLLAQTTVGAWQWNGTLEGATNFDFMVWAYYIPPEPVHTNGVWVYKSMKDRGGKFAIPIRARIEVNGKAIATPAEKRKDEER